MQEHFFTIMWEELVSCGLNPRSKNPRIENYLKDVIKMRLQGEDIRKPFKLKHIRYCAGNDSYQVKVET